MKKIVLVGASGSGKDYLLAGLIKKGFKYSPKITTRPIREGEQEGINYHYTTNSEFDLMVENHQIKCYQKFLIGEVFWNYGITSQNFHDNELFIMTPFEVNALTDEDRSLCNIIYLNMAEDVRRSRIRQRNDDNDSIDRRIEADKLDFHGFDKYNVEVKDPVFNIEDIYNRFINI